MKTDLQPIAITDLSSLRTVQETEAENIIGGGKKGKKLKKIIKIKKLKKLLKACKP